MVVGGIWLLGKQKIYLDHETKEPVQVELPGGIRLKANSPALALFLIGFIPLLYPVYKLDPQKYHAVETATLTGKFDPQEHDLIVYASAVQAPVIRNRNSFQISVPFVADQGGEYGNVNYEVLVLFNDLIVSQATATLKDRNESGEIPVRLSPFIYPKKNWEGEVDPLPDSNTYPKDKVRSQ